MFTLFNPPYTRFREPIIIPLYAYYINQTNLEVNKLRKFYDENVYTAKSTDRWLKFLITIETYINLSPSKLVSVIRENSPRLNNQFGLVSPLNTSKIQSPGTMYNRNIPELFLSVEYPIDADKAVSNYKRLEPIKVVSHDFSDFSYGICNGNYASGEKGLAIFTVDLAILALQFQQWCIHERLNKVTNANRQTTEFIAKYLWPSIVTSHIDNVLFNRLVNQLDDKPNAPSNNQHSFYLADFGNGFDQQNATFIDTLKRKPMGWMERLQSLPSIRASNYYESMLFPDMAPTRQVRWAMVLSKLKMVEFVLKTDQFAQNKALSLADRTTIQRELRILLNDRSFEIVVPEEYMNRIHWCYDQVNKE